MAHRREQWDRMVTMDSQSQNQSLTFKNFNPSKDSRVDDIKEATDDLIKMVDKYSNDTPEGRRRAALAKTNYEQAAMWAVKALFS